MTFVAYNNGCAKFFFDDHGLEVKIFLAVRVDRKKIIRRNLPQGNNLLLEIIALINVSK